MSTDLDPDAGLLTDDDIVHVRSRGVAGTVSWSEPGDLLDGPGRDEVENDLDLALADLGLTERRTVALEDTRAPDVGAVSMNRDGTESVAGPVIELEVAPPEPGMAQVVLEATEGGSLRWHFPDIQPTLLADVGQRQIFTVPHYNEDAAPALGGEAVDGINRGPIGALARKVLKVLVFDALQHAGGIAADKLGRHFEGQSRPHRLRAFGVDDYGTNDAPDLAPERLRQLAAGPCLLFVHGNASTTAGGFRRLPSELVEELDARYEGRVFAFDHPTIAFSPLDNVAWLDQHLAALGDGQLEVDIVAHSRGGLVSRLLAQHPELTSNRVVVRRLVMVATPNAGTALADQDRVGELLDILTNMITIVPGGAADALASVAAAVKHLAVGAWEGLDGLQSMDPDSDFLKELNVGNAPDPRYFAAASDFEPAPGSRWWSLAEGRRSQIGDSGLDYVFESVPNDLVVPTRGVHHFLGLGDLADRAPGVLPSQQLEIGPVRSIDHSQYWIDEDFQSDLLVWLAPLA